MNEIKTILKASDLLNLLKAFPQMHIIFYLFCSRFHSPVTVPRSQHPASGPGAHFVAEHDGGVQQRRAVEGSADLGVGAGKHNVLEGAQGGEQHTP